MGFTYTRIPGLAGDQDYIAIRSGEHLGMVSRPRESLWWRAYRNGEKVTTDDNPIGLHATRDLAAGALLRQKVNQGEGT